MSVFENMVSVAWWRTVFQRHGQKAGWLLAVIFSLPLVIGFGISQYSRGGPSINNASAANNVVATVNGQPITEADFQGAARQFTEGQPAGEQFAQAEGRALNQLVTQTVAQQEAKRAGVAAADADIDRAMAQERERALPKGASDGDWENYVEQQHGMSSQEYRDALAQRLLVPALFQKYKSDEKVSDQDVRNQTAEVKLQDVLVGTLSANSMMMNQPGMPPKLPDPMAQKKANDLHAQAEKGADLAALARANSTDFTSKQGGVMGWRPEYKSSPAPGASALGYGKDFDDAVHNTPKGGITPVVKATGFNSGYIFAKVLDRRNTPPKDFNATTARTDLQTQRAQQKLTDLIQAKVKAANIDWKDPDKKAYYDFAKLRDMEQEQMMAQFGQGDPKTAPTKADVDKLQATVDQEMVALQKRHPDDATADLLAAETVKKQMNAAGNTPQQRDALRDQVIALYEAALKYTEDRNVRFELADMYRDKKQPDMAYKHYSLIARLLNAEPPYDMQSMQDAQTAHQRLQAAFKSINKPEDAATEQKRLTEVEKQMADQRKKDAEAQKAQAGAPGGATANVPAGRSSVQNITIPAGPGNSGAARPGAAPSAGAATAPSAPGNATSPSTAAPTAGGAKAPATQNAPAQGASGTAKPAPAGR